MAATQAQNPLKFTDGFAISKSDSVLISAQADNTLGYKHCFVHNRDAGGDVKVTTVDGKDITIFIAQGATSEIAVIKVFSAGTTPSNLVGYIGKV